MHNSIDRTSASVSPQPAVPFSEVGATRPNLDYSSQLSSAVGEQLISKDPNLSHLQEQIKTAMMRVLVEVFDQIGEARAAANPPTRLQIQPEITPQEAKDKLLRLHDDLKAAEQWNSACLTQVKKALQEIDQLMHGAPSTTVADDKSSWVKRLFGDKS